MPNAGELSVEEAFDFWKQPDAIDPHEEVDPEAWVVVKTTKLAESFENWFVSRDCFDACTTVEVAESAADYDDAVRLARSVRDRDVRFDGVADFPDAPPYCSPPEHDDEVVIVSVEKFADLCRRRTGFLAPTPG